MASPKVSPPTPQSKPNSTGQISCAPFVAARIENTCGTKKLATSSGATSHAATPWISQYTSHDQRLIPRNGMKLLADASPPSQWKSTPSIGLAPPTASLAAPEAR